MAGNLMSQCDLIVSVLETFVDCYYSAMTLLCFWDIRHPAILFFSTSSRRKKIRQQNRISDVDAEGAKEPQG